MSSEELRSPIQISSRLQAGVPIPCNHDRSQPDVWVQVAKTPDVNHQGKPLWRITIDLPHQMVIDDTLAGWGNTAEMLATALAFLGACAESYPDGENADLFCQAVAEWADQHSDEITCAELDIRHSLGQDS